MVSVQTIATIVVKAFKIVSIDEMCDGKQGSGFKVNLATKVWNIGNSITGEGIVYEQGLEVGRIKVY